MKYQELLGIKMANPDKEVISFVGDGSYLDK
jgi:TPP-dependent trihydroxycyclohexane-1,2-dione (THcHDO) dehydratase